MQELPVAVVLVKDIPVLHFQQRLADLGLARRVAVFHGAADHAFDNPVLADIFGLTVERFDGSAIAQDGNLVGDFADLVQLVRDDDRGHSLRAKLHQELQKRIGIGFVERGGRLVEDQEPHLLRKRLGDLDQLLLADADVGDERCRALAEAHLLQELLGAGKGLRPVDHAVAGDLVAEEDVLGDRQQRHQRQFLVDDDDAKVFAVGDRREATRFATVVDLAFIGAGGIDAAQHLHQRRLAGAVFADERVDLAFADLEADIVQRLDARERLGDAPHFKNDIVHVQSFQRQSAREYRLRLLDKRARALARALPVEKDQLLIWSSV
ncbi:hypothetical protein D9M68_354510 [compost metagenome]